MSNIKCELELTFDFDAVTGMFKILSELLGRAMDWGLVVHNPAWDISQKL